jgi:hypothetical protein
VADRDRIRRPPLDRTEPIRAWSGMFGGGPLNDVVSRSVELGYRVVDEYIRQGQKAAGRFGSRALGADTLPSDVQDFGVRMMQYTSDVFGLWFEMMNAMMAPLGAPTRPPPARQNGNGHRPVERAPDVAARTRVRVEVVSTRPAEVAVDLRPDAAGRSLVVHGLRAADATLPRLDDVAIAADGDGVALRIRVPPDLPAGTYNGLVIDDETSAPVGTVSLRVAAA